MIDAVMVQVSAAPAAETAKVGADGAAALLRAAERNDTAAADRLLSAGANAKAANDFGATPLYAAAAVATIPATLCVPLRRSRS